MTENHLLLANSKGYGAINVDAGDNWEHDNVAYDDDETVGDIEKSAGTQRKNTFMDDGGSSVASVKSFLGASFNDFRRASMSVSMLAKPSDDRKASAPLAGWNVSNLIQGTGILGVPYAVQQGGWAAVFMIFFVALLCCHTGKLLIDCMYETSKKTGIRRRLRVNYPDVGEACLGHRGLVLIGIIQSIEMFSGVVMYVILLGTAWADLFKVYSNHLGLKEWAAINCVLALPSLFITRMSIVSWLSMFSVFSLMSALLVLITFTLTQAPLWSISHIPAFNPQTFPIGFGIIVFSYCAHAVFPSIEGSMKKPSQFNGMMNCSFLLAAIVKACLGSFMVLRFGKATAEVATVNLADHVVFSRLSTALVISNVILAVPLAMFVVTATIDEALLGRFPNLNRDSRYHWVWLLITRPLAIGFALFIAVMVPFFGLIMGVVGSFTGSCLCFIFPCVFHITLRRKTMKKREFIVDILIICFGVVAGTTGLIFSMKSLVMAFIEHHNI